jgi:hypothetical protein
VLRTLNGGVSEYYEALARRHGEKDNRRFPSGDRVRFLLAGMKAAALQLPSHSAWPVLSALRADCVLALSGRVGVGQTGFQACSSWLRSTQATSESLNEAAISAILPRGVGQAMGVAGSHRLH